MPNLPTIERGPVTRVPLFTGEIITRDTSRVHLRDIAVWFINQGYSIIFGLKKEIYSRIISCEISDVKVI